MKRTDIHRPSAINPKDYEFVAFGYQKVDFFGGMDPAVLLLERERVKRHMQRTGGTWSDHEHGGNCHICGAYCIYTVIFHHIPTNVYIRTGNDCADKMEISYGDFNAFKARMHDAREAHAGKMKAKTLLEDRGLTRGWEIYAANGSGLPREEQIIIDVIGKLVKYGRISDNQYGLIEKLLAAIDGRAELAAKRAAEAEAAAPCPEGRVELSGVILSTRVDDGPYGKTIKMLFQADEGYKLWGTMPSDAGGKGQHIVFKASVTPSKEDPKFGFFKRPILLMTGNRFGAQEG